MTWLRGASLVVVHLVAQTALSGCSPDDGAPPLASDASTSTSTTTPEGTSETSEGGSTGFQPICTPGETRCGGSTAVEVCAPTGLEWLEEPCQTHSECHECAEDEACEGAVCRGPCDSADELPSSAGCAFVASRQAHMNEGAPDGLIVANPNDELVATIQLYFTPLGKRELEPFGDPIMLAPGETTTFELTMDFVPGSKSNYRTGDIFQVESDVPIVAYQHAPLTTRTGNDSSMLLPLSALGQDYVAYSFPARTSAFPYGPPSYFEIIAVEDSTKVEWTPRNMPTSGNGVPIPPVEQGETGSMILNRFDTIRIAASSVDVEEVNQDVSGTVIHSDKPIWVVSGCRCAEVPILGEDDPPFAGCDPLQEQLLPLDYWGTRYVAAHSPVRGNERHHWRVYAGKDGITVTTDPPQPGTPHTFSSRGEYIDIEVPNATSFIIEGDGPFMPVQYMQSAFLSSFDLSQGTTLGDPSMYQMVPTEQFLSRYVFVTPDGFDFNFVQVIRKQGDAEITLDGDPVSGYYSVGSYEVADVAIDSGSHLIESDDPFGILQVGYTSDEVSPLCQDPEGGPDETCFSSYAYPGGMKREEIFIP